jgi:YspA, cpYpsA-related SLOG family
VNRVLVFGGRDYRNADHVSNCLFSLRANWGVFVIINGGARGADTLARDWGLAQAFPVITMEAPWGALGKEAGRTRNLWMLEHATPTHGVMFPGGAGTRHMRSLLEARGVPVWPA